MEFRLFLPQMRMSLEQIVDRSQAAERAGFGGIALMDHLAPPLAAGQPMFDAMVAATWIAARTELLGVGHLVLCDAFRHPAVLAKQAVTLDHASSGRFELGIGWGSVPAEYSMFGVGPTETGARVRRLGETLEVLRMLWSGEPVDFDGEFHHLEQARQAPVPTASIPIVIGGSGPRTLALVSEYADWWNLPLHQIARLDDVRGSIGSARVSIQLMVALVVDERDRTEVTNTAMRRFSHHGDALIVGNAGEVAERLAEFGERGVERCYVWFADFAEPRTIEEFGGGVITQFLEVERNRHER